MQLADKFKFKNIALPRPGCSNGGLMWDDVSNEICSILDDRVTIVTKFFKSYKKEK